MELQKSLPDFDRAGVAVFAVSYDPVRVLTSFGDKHGITYSLLSDEGSQVIRALGLLNQHVAEQQAYYNRPVRDYHQGISYPGSFVLDQQGIVVERRFEQSYRVRPTAVSLVETVFGGESTIPAVKAEAGTDDLQVLAWVASPTYHPYEKLLVNLAIRVVPGLHVYGRPIPAGYTPLTVEVDPLPGLESDGLHLPEPRPFRVEGLEEQFRIYQGSLHAVLPLALKENLGFTQLVVRLRYQACSETACYLPKDVTLRLLLAGLDSVGE